MGQEFQDEIAPIQDDVTHMNQLASTFGPHDIQLSPTNLERIDDLNTRWRLLQVCAQTRAHRMNSGVKTLICDMLNVARGAAPGLSASRKSNEYTPLLANGGFKPAASIFFLSSVTA